MLRNYQQHGVDMTLDLWAQGLRSVLFVCPTGGGKTHVFAELARLEAQGGGRVLVLADRKRLIDQAADRCRDAGLSVGFEQAARRTGKKLSDVVCATIQSIGRTGRLRRFKPDAFSLIVLDEADLGIAPSYRAVLDYFADAKVFGCTATPDRADGQSLGEIFEDVAATVDMGDLIRAKHLSPIRRHLVRIESVSLEKLSAKDGDFSDVALTRILTQERPLHEVVRPALDLAGDRPSLVFAATVAHAEALAEVFNRYRPGAARVIHGGMGDGERDAIIDAFERREFQFLCNCALLLRGVDLPFVSCIVGARPTLSRALYAQSIGRGTRVAPGKADLLVLDFTDNSATHDLVSPIDVLAPAAPEEVKERAREIMDEEQGADPLEVLDRAEAQLEADPALRERVRAKVEFKLREASGIDWDAQPLGTVADSVIAKTLGIPQSRVHQARSARGIAPSLDMQRPRRHAIDWASQPLGKVSDAELGRVLGVDVATVRVARNKRGIPPTPYAARGKGNAKGIDWTAQPLGEIPDSAIARTLGVDKSAVAAARRVLGIGAAPGAVRAKGIVWDEQPLGQETDVSLARRLGVSAHSVLRARQSRGIAPYRPEAAPTDRLIPERLARLSSLISDIGAADQSDKGAAEIVSEMRR